MDHIDNLRIFIRIAACGSFSQAADQLGVPRASVSLAVQQLESRLGTRLLHRTTRRVGLTLDGETLLDRASALVADMEDIDQLFRPSGKSIGGRLRVDVPNRVARRLMVPALPDFLEKHPQVAVELGSSDRLIDLVQEGVDCALRVGVLPSSSLVARPVGVFEVINCASPAYLESHGSPAGPEDLPRHVAVDYVSPTSGRATPWEWQEGSLARSCTMNSKVTVNSAESYIGCALAGLGLIQVPRFDVRKYLHTGELVEVMVQAKPAALPVHWVYPHRRTPSSRVQAFLTWAESVLQPHLAIRS
ncbi:MAG: LysR family transcriptional regulator [Ideonella sp.]|nr:LysR family transcriptional regulator [Ideonella sp.]